MVEIKRLNKEQKAAVLHRDGPAIVVAGAGTGKTAVITLRIAELIRSGKAKPEEILALTFTEKAAYEMQDRVDLLLPIGFADVDIMTFHSFGDRFLRDYSLEIGLPSDYVVMNTIQQALFIQEVIDKLDLSYHKPLSNPFSFVNGLISFISKLKDEAITPEDLKTHIKSVKTPDKEEKQRLKELVQIFSAYEDQKIKKSLVDYADQILLPLQILNTKKAIRKLIQAKYKYILVDEFQDTNFTQAELLKLIAKKTQNIFVVGDDDQSIYRFRGAAIENILNFRKDYPKAKQYVLSQNYRSGQEILDKAYQLIQNNNPYRLEIQNKLTKRIHSRLKTRKPEAKVFENTVEEMEFVAKTIKKLAKAGVKYKNMAVLLRKNNQAGKIIYSLQNAEIPFVLSENRKLFEQPEIKAILHFINVVNDQKDSQAFFGHLCSEINNLVFTEVSQIATEAAKTNQSLEIYARGSLEVESEPVRICREVDLYRELADELNAGELIYEYLKSSGYLEKLVKRSEKDNASAAKLQNIASFFTIIKDFEQVSKDTSIYSLWDHLVQISKSEVEIPVESSPLDIDAVNITTVHKAKGLEYEAVFVIDMVEQTFPSVNRAEKIRIPEGIFREDKTINWHVHEERRLFYVAITRAKRYLFVSSALNHGLKRLKRPSRFVEETFGRLKLPEMSAQKSSLDSLTAFERLKTAKYDPMSRFYDSEGWLNLTTNQIADYLRSPREFWYFHVLKLPKGPFHALVYGSAIHAAIEHFYRAQISKKPVSLKNLYSVFENSWKSEGFVSLSHEKDRFRRGREVLKHLYLKEKNKRPPLYVEKPFVLRLNEQRVKISGRYDAIFQNKKGIEITDFKTSDVKDQKSAEKRLKQSLQMQIYALAWSKLEKTPLNSVSLRFLEADIVAKTENVDNHATINTIEKAAEGIKSKKFGEKGQSQINFEKLL